MKPVYCEQPTFSGFFEPVNTLTNLIFIIAAIYLFISLKRRNQLDSKAIYLTIVLICIGLGSASWHVYRSTLTFICDSLPIAIFVASFLWFYLALTVKKIIYRILFFIGFFLFIVGLSILFKQYDNSDAIGNGGLKYLAAIGYFGLLQVYNMYHKRELIAKSLLTVLLFVISFIFRQTDLVFCDKIVFGTHFLWHIFIAVVLYMFVRLLYPGKLKEIVV
ncbi:MAG: ceramidase domain-containing protein [Bacteroidales bacterium]|nr:ceramidase domain-containing protein [Bacteroidales bacterium]